MSTIATKVWCIEFDPCLSSRRQAEEWMHLLNNGGDGDDEPSDSKVVKGLTVLVPQLDVSHIAIDEGERVPLHDLFPCIEDAAQRPIPFRSTISNTKEQSCTRFMFSASYFKVTQHILVHFPPIQLYIRQLGADDMNILLSPKSTATDLRKELERQMHEKVDTSDRFVVMSEQGIYSSNKSSEREVKEKIAFCDQGIRDGTLLTMVRDSKDRIYHYVCGQCDAMVQLRRVDLIACKNCGSNIVFKPRTTNPCVYLAR